MKDIQIEVNYYNSLKCEFTDFINVPKLDDGDIFLVC